VHDKAAKNPDYVLSVDDIHSWELRHGRIRGAFVAMRTIGQALAGRQSAGQQDAAGVFHYPGWSMPVLKLLYEERGITASPRDQDTDPGLPPPKTIIRWILHSRPITTDRVLANLDQVPRREIGLDHVFPRSRTAPVSRPA